MTILPSARIDVFFSTSQTHNLVENISGDWRFDRVKLASYEGDGRKAIETYQKKDSPDLIILETQSIDKSFISLLEELGGVCTQDTNAVVIGPDNDIRLYRKLKEMGVSDYYVHPVSSDDFKNDVADIIIRSKGISESRIYTFMGAKGGVGTSSLAQASASAIAYDLEETCLILDCAGGRSYTTIALAQSEPSGTLGEAVRAALAKDHERLGRLITKTNTENLFALSTGGEEILTPMPDPEEFEALLFSLASRYSHIVLDLGGANASNAMLALKNSTDIALVSHADLISLRPARALFREMQSLRGDNKQGLHYIINQYGQNPTVELGKKDIPEAMGGPPSALISHNEKLFAEYQMGEKKLHEQEAGHQIMQALLGIFHGNTLRESNSSKNLDKSKKKNSVFGGFINKFTS